MSLDGKTDFYEVLQVSANAEPDTIHRVYRLLAQRFHPDNTETGNADRFHQIHEAYTVLSNPKTEGSRCSRRCTRAVGWTQPHQR
jgi:DnaJ-class molecular chaperone